MSQSSWMIAFADLAAVLTGFFVLMLSMSEFDTPRIEDLLDDLGPVQGAWSKPSPTVAPPAAGVLRDLQDLPTDTSYLATVIRGDARAADWPLKVRATDQGVVLRPNADVADSFLLTLGDYLAGSGLAVSIRAVFPDSATARATGFGVYDVGLARAETVATALVTGGLPGPLPIESRIASDLDTFRLEIVVRQALELTR
ncbi:MAG: flagellar motor protein MotB [Minwuia sp.]|nr:flagellar motor protein MotB [Minwuia sp.]